MSISRAKGLMTLSVSQTENCALLGYYAACIWELLSEW